MIFPEEHLLSICKPKQWKTISSKDLTPDGYTVYGANGKIGFYKEYTHKAPTIMVTCRGATCGTINISDPFSYISGNAMALDSLDTTRVSFSYLAHYLKKRGFADVIRGAAQPQITRTSLTDVKIPLPPLDEQKRIAAVLDKADALRRHRKEALELTEKFLQSVFLDMFGDFNRNENDWPVLPFFDLVTNTLRNGLSPSTNGTVPGRVLTLTSITKGVFDASYSRDAHFEKLPTKKQTLSTETFLICRGNGNKSLVGAGVFPDKDYPNICFPDTIIGCNPDAKTVKPNFLQFAWKSTYIRSQIESAARTANGTYKINQKALSELKIVIPPIDLQEKFSDIYNNVKSILGLMAEQELETNSFFSSLQQRAFRGELDLTRVPLLEEQSDSPEPTEKEPVSGDSPPPDTSLSRTQAALDIPTEIKTFLEPLDEEVAKGELINWSPEFFKYRIIGDKMNRPFTFEELMLISNTIFYDSPPYEEAKAIVFEMLEAKQLKQTFDEQPNRRAVVLDLA